MNTKIKYPYLWLFAIQVLLALIAFKDFRIHPSNIIFNAYGDGLKNYFTLLSYVNEQPGAGGAFGYNIFNYPFGESIYTTDNTPFFAIPFKWFCHHVVDVSAHTLAVYNTCIILNIIVCSLLVFAVFRRLVQQDVVSFIAAVVLAWSNMQTLRIWRGHFNLSLSSLLVLSLLLIVLWNKQQEHKNKRWWIAIALVALNYFAFFVHGYYLAIIGVFQAAALFFFGLYRIKSKDGKLSIMAAIVVPATAVALSLLTLKATDIFYSLRTPGANGYDWMEQKVRFWALFKDHDFYRFHFPLRTMLSARDADNVGFLGTFGLYALCIMIGLAIANKYYREYLIKIQKDIFHNPIIAPILWAGLLLLMINFGENYYTQDLYNGFHIINYLNPFYYLHLFTDTVTQFRSLSRFAWPFFWTFNIWVCYSLVQFLPALSKKGKNVFLIVLMLIAGSEVRDYIDAMQGNARDANPLAPEAYHYLSSLKIDYSKYQALLALPYYNVGSEVSPLIIDDVEALSVSSFQMVLHSGLPLMNTKLSRTVAAQAAQLDSLVAFDIMPKAIKEKLDSRPILVMVNKDLAQSEPPAYIAQNEAMKTLYNNSLKLPERHGLQPIDSIGNLYFYSLRY